MTAICYEKEYKGTLIIIPTGRGGIDIDTVRGLLRVQDWFIKNNHEYGIMLHQSSLPIHQLRSDLANRFMHLTTYKRMIFIDDDIGFDESAIAALIAIDEPLVVGAYPLRRETSDLVFAPRKENGQLVYHPKYPNAIEVLQSGTGFMKIDRSVFEKMRDFGISYDSILNKELEGKVCYHYFDTWVDVTEDYAFCRRYRETGGSIWLALDAKLSHIGRHEFKFDRPIKEWALTLPVNGGGGG